MNPPTIPPSRLGDLAAAFELVKVRQEITKLSAGLLGSQHGAYRKPWTPQGRRVSPAQNVWTQLAPQNPQRRLLVLSTNGGGPGTINTIPLPPLAAPYGIFLGQTTPMVMTERDWGQAMQWEWWYLHNVAGTVIMVLEAVEL